MNTNEIYQKITENIIEQFKAFKSGQIKPRMLNENLILNLSSMCKFLKGKESMNNSVLDLYVPTTRLEHAVNSKLKISTRDQTLIEGDQNINPIRKPGENLYFDRNSFFGESSFVGNQDDFLNSKNDKILERQSLMSKDNFSQLGDLLDRTEISTIYGKDNNCLDESLVSGSEIGFNTTGFNEFQKKINSQSFGDLSFIHSTSQRITMDNNLKNIPNQVRNSLGLNKFKSEPSKNMISLDESSTSMVNISNLENKDGSGTPSLISQLINEVKGELKEKAVKEFIKEMNADYIRAMWAIYSKIRDVCDKNQIHGNLVFINQFKSFVLEIGISEKKFYEQCIREIIYNKNKLTFLEFILCFHKLIYLKFDQNFLKYKFLFHITQRKNEEYMDLEEIHKFFDLLRAKKIYDMELHNKISSKFVEKYKDIFPNDNNKFFVRKLALVLEQFFDLK